MAIIEAEKPGWCRKTTSQTYLLDVAEMKDGETVYLTDSNRTNIPVKSMQEALDAQWPGLKCKASSHGSARYVTRKAMW